jgi:hypothetical protein
LPVLGASAYPDPLPGPAGPSSALRCLARSRFAWPSRRALGRGSCVRRASVLRTARLSVRLVPRRVARACPRPGPRSVCGCGPDCRLPRVPLVRWYLAPAPFLRTGTQGNCSTGPTSWASQVPRRRHPLPSAKRRSPRSALPLCLSLNLCTHLLLASVFGGYILGQSSSIGPECAAKRRPKSGSSISPRTCGALGITLQGHPLAWCSSEILTLRKVEPWTQWRRHSIRGCVSPLGAARLKSLQRRLPRHRRPRPVAAVLPAWRTSGAFSARSSRR